MPDSEMSRQDGIVAAQYDRWARVYDRLWRRYVNQTIPVLQRVASVRAGERVLDLACGTGAFERRVSDAGADAELVGIDISAAMVERARRKLKGRSGIRFEQADAHDLPFDDNAFDAVVCANTFHYFTHPRTVLEEAARVLRSEGRLVLLDWCRDFWACRVMDVVLTGIDPAYDTCYTLDELTALIDQAELRTQYTFRYRFDLVWGMMVATAIPRAA